jgi:tetratricopeptide (TPR) repeat protein
MDVPPDDFAGRETNDPRVLTGRAASSLAVGRVDEASADLERALQLDPKNSDALALQSIIALVQNDTDEARTLAQKSVEADRQSTSGYIARSYAQQAQFDLEGARSSLDKAVEVNADDALAWARLAEIRSSLGEQDGALEAAKKAVALNPNLSRTQTVLGFAYLMQVNTHEAKEAFNKAIQFDQADPLPRLGLGLAKIREWGGLAEGRAELETAATLDPNNSLIRSYLGKAFFEEKNDSNAEREFATAKELDPKDPTPYFYEALQKQLTNRPVEALEDMEKAMELNENRAVYRSRLSLDSDLAARSASMARIYRNLGFENQALVEGWTSVNKDQTSFAAHRFLADSYSALPRHEIARVSELLKSQLLQPINITPIQPTLAVSNLFLLSSLGPGASSFNEFNTLVVNRDRLTVLGSGLIGENDTQAGEGVVAGIYKNLSYSAGISNFNTDGWDSNTHQKDMNANAFLQLEISPRTSIQAEYRYRNLQRGDLQQRFFDDDQRQSLNDAERKHTIRGGLRHEFDPHSTVLTSFIYNNSSQAFRDSPPINEPPVGLGPGGGPPFAPLVLFEFETKTNSLESYQGEAQYLLRSQLFNLELGGGYSHLNGTPLLSLAIDASGLGGPPFVLRPGDPSQVNADTRHVNGYAYGYFQLLKNLTITAGGSYDWVDGPSDSFLAPGDDFTQFNPKFGIIYHPLPETTIRAAAFKVLKRTLITDQTLEPTQVAGFNQFYDDLNQTEAWRYGLAIQHKFKNHLTIGAEGSIRNTTFTFVNTTGQRDFADGDEYQAGGYAFYTPHPWVALSGKFTWEKFKNDFSFGETPIRVDTYTVPLAIGFFHPSGVLANLNVAYWDQNGKFRQMNTFTNNRTGDDDWWLVDAAVGYRMPKRYGLITVGVKNLFDKDFNYYNTDLRNPFIQPERLVFGQVTLALP